VRLTERDRHLLKRLQAYRWLSTRQVAALCFPATALQNVRRRLRILRAARYVRSVQPHAMAQALHAPGTASRQLFGDHVKSERVPPQNLEHFLGVNDLRIAVERSAARDGIHIGYWFAAWELQPPLWPFAVIPDAVCELKTPDRTVTVLFEYDRGTEGLRYLTEKKFKRYAEGLDGFLFSRVLTVVESATRLRQVRSYAARHLPANRFAFLERDDLAHWSVRSLLEGGGS
jgi:hypothetical protein